MLGALRRWLDGEQHSPSPQNVGVRLRGEVLEQREVPALLPSFVVDTVRDTPDANPADGVPQDANGRVSLRSVFTHITLNPSPGNTFQIEFANVLRQTYWDQAGNPVPYVPGNTMTVELASQLPAVLGGQDIIIAGSTTRRVTITRDPTVNPADKFRFLEVLASGKLEVRGLKFTNADNRVGNGTGLGGAMLNNGGGILDVVNCYFQDNLADAGGAIGNQGTLTVTGWAPTGAKTEFVHNGATGVGGAINTGALAGPGAPACSVSITDATFDDNVSGDVVLWVGTQKGGAIGHHTAGGVTVTKSEFRNNKADEGGAIYADGAAVPTVNVTVEDSKFESNTASSDGGAVWIWGLGAEFRRCRFDLNSAVSEGGAVYHALGSLLLDACNFFGNTAAGAMGSNDVGNLVGPGNPSTVTQINGSNAVVVSW